MKNGSLHSILVKSIQNRKNMETIVVVALHSILVKSIRGWQMKIYRHLPALHSILVKSIHFPVSKFEHLYELYIPFWLNLYSLNFNRLVIAETLYIPFWLNLYGFKSHFFTTFQIALHSILVKSIHGS